MSSDNVRQMRAISSDVVIRDRPSFDGLNAGWVYEGNTIDVDLSTRTEAEDHVWVKHIRGWSPERKLDGTEIFLVDNIKDAFFIPGETHENSAPPTPPADEAEDDIPAVDDSPAEVEKVTVEKAGEDVAKVEVSKADSPDEAAKVGVTGGGPGSEVKAENKLEARVKVNVRDKPSTRGTVDRDAALVPGTIVTYDPDATVEAEGYVWVKHERGWSALRPIGEGDAFLVAPGGPPNEDAPDPESLPGYRTLIKRLPVDIDQTVWFQYFGNNVFAYTDGTDFNYDGYSQGLHGGLDFANKAAGVPIYAAADCQYVEIKRRSPNLQIWTQTGDYTFIYQHITNARSFKVGEAISADTVVAEIEPVPWFHLHFEVRYKDNWIINPLLLMSDELVQQITDKFNPDTPSQWPSKLKFFFRNKNWAKWTSPLDQPIIKRRGRLLGPKAQ